MFEHVIGNGDTEVARIAELQRGCIHREQLLAAGLGRRAIARRLKTARLHALHRAVYLVGLPRFEPMTRAMAAALHFRGDALVSHRSAAAIWGLVDDHPERVSVTVVGRSAHTRGQLDVHRVPALDRVDIRHRHGIPVTSPARTLLDLAGTLDSLELENALSEPRRRNLARDNQIAAAIARTPGRSGAGILKQLLETRDLAATRSLYERRLLKLISAAELPRPATNIPLHGHLVDMLWPEQRLVVEIDGFQFHGDRAAFERDRRRDQRLVAAGYRVIRVTARQIDGAPYAVIARIAAALMR